MNTANKITMSRIYLAVLMLFVLMFPWYQLGIQFPMLNLIGKINIDSKYLVAGVLFIIASVTDFLDGMIARKYGLITNTGKMLDAIADKVLVNSVLIILAANGFINAIIPVVVVLRDIVVNAIKMEAAGKGVVVAAIKSGKLKTATLMIGTVLVFFYNLPFEIWGISVGKVLLLIATVLSITSGIQYYSLNKHLISTK